jgi:hypothetical protein
MSPRLALAAAAVLAPVASLAQDPAPSPQARDAARGLASAYMQHVACTAHRTGMGLKTVAEMTWHQAAAADRAFRRVHNSSVLDALGVGQGHLLKSQARV